MLPLGHSGGHAWVARPCGHGVHSDGGIKEVAIILFSFGTLKREHIKE